MLKKEIEQIKTRNSLFLLIYYIMVIFMKKIKIDENLKFIFIVTFIIGLINYFLLYTNNVMSFDTTANGRIFLASGWEFDLGRALLLVVDRLRFGLVAPFLIIIISLTFISLSIYYLCKIFNVNDKLKIILITLLVTLFPSFSDSATYIYCFDSYTLSFFLSVLTVYFLKDNKYIFSIICAISSLLLYQSYIAVTISLIFLLYIEKALNHEFDLKEFIKKLLIIFISLVIYYVGYSLMLKVLGRSFASYKGADSFGLKTFLNIGPSIINSYKDFFSFLFDDNIIFNTFYKRNILNLIIVIISIYLLFKNYKKQNNFYLILLVLAFPIAINILDLIAMDTRIILMTGSSLLTFYLIIILRGNKFVYVPLVLLMWTYLLSNYATYYQRIDIYNNFYNKASEILIRAKTLDEYDSSMPYMINDIMRYDSVYYPMTNGFVSREDFTFDAYLGVELYEELYKRFLNEDIDIVDYDKYREIAQTEEYKNMKIGSIKIINGVITVKISDWLY